MPRRHRLELTAPSGDFHTGFPLGNGALGAMVHGRPGVEQVDLNLDTLWSGGPDRRTGGPAPARRLPELRHAIRSGDHAGAEEIARSMQAEDWTESFQPLGTLRWPYAAVTQTGPEDYRRVLDLRDALAVTAYNSGPDAVRLESFVSAPGQVLVMTASGPGAAGPALPEFVAPHPGTSVSTSRSDGVQWLVATGRAPAKVLPDYVHAEPAVVYGPDGTAPDGTVDAGMGFAVVVAVLTGEDGRLRLLLSAVSGFRGYDRRPSGDLPALAAAARHRVEAALRTSPDELRTAHVRDHRELFDRVDLDLSASVESSGPAAATGAARAELLFHFGRYLLIASSRPGSQAANLQGIWNVDVRPGWSSNYTTNINVEMNYWPAEVVALGELHEPMLRLTRELAEAGRTTARQYYGAGGSAAHHNTDLWRYTAPVNGDPQWSNWPSALWWMSAHVWDHIDYGADEAFVAGTAVPVLREAARFALDLLVPDPSGRLVVSPSTSPEHQFVPPAGPATSVSEGTTMDQELVRDVLVHYLELARRLPGPQDQDLAERASRAVQQLRAPGIGADGTLLEWADDREPLEPGHRHLSHLYGLFPGTRITQSATPLEFEAARRALRTRLDKGSGYTGWSQAWVLCLAARLREPVLAEESIGILLDHLTSDSMLDLHPHDGWPSGAIFQIDGNLGAVAGIAELLVQSHEGVIGLFNAVPESWPAGTVRGIRCRGGHRVDVEWSAGRLRSARVTAGRGPELLLETPAGAGTPLVFDEAGSAVACGPRPCAVADRSRFGWTVESGAAYDLRWV